MIRILGRAAYFSNCHGVNCTDSQEGFWNKKQTESHSNARHPSQTNTTNMHRQYKLAASGVAAPGQTRACAHDKFAGAQVK